MDDQNIWKGWRCPEVPQTHGTAGYKRRNNNRVAKRRRHYLRLLAALDEKLTGARAGAPHLKFPSEILATLFDQVANEVRMGVHERRSLHNLLVAGIQRGVAELGWQADPPNKLTIMARTANPQPPQSFALLRKVHAILPSIQVTLDDEWLRLRSDENPQTARLRWGQIFVSAMLLGGLLDRHALPQLPALCGHLKRYREHVWIEFFSAHAPTWAQGKRPPRRWYVDPATLILLRRAPTVRAMESQKEHRRWMYDCMSAYLTHVIRMLHPQQKIRALKRSEVEGILTGIEQFHYQRLPPFLMHYTLGDAQTTALPQLTLERILRDRAYQGPSLSVELPEPDSTHIARITKRPRGHVPTLAATLYKKARDALHRSRKEPEPPLKQVMSRIAAVRIEAEQTSPVMATLLIFLHDRIRQKAIRRSTAYQYLTQLGSELVDRVGEEDFFSIDSTTWLGVYEEIIEDAKSLRSKQAKAALIHQFERYRSDLWDLPSVHIRLTSDGLIASADANLITETEYLAIRDVLKKQAKNPLGHVALMIFTLGYRCGLRINEALTIRLNDLHYRSMSAIQPEGEQLSPLGATLLVRANTFNKLKSEQGRRQLPLDLLLPEDELLELLESHQSRLRAVASTAVKVGQDLSRSNLDRFMFSNAAHPNAPMSVDEVEDLIHPMLRQMTGDTSLRFHHLRHSFAHQLLQAMSGKPPLTPLPVHWHEANAQSPHGARIRQHVMPEGLPSHKNMHMIAEWIGHSHPSVTTKHYLHAHDWLLRQHLEPLSFNAASPKKNPKEKPVAHLYQAIDPAKYVPKMLGMKDEAYRQQKSRHGSIMAWLPNKLGIGDRAETTEGWVVRSETLPIPLDPMERTAIDLNEDEWYILLKSLREGRSKKDIARMLYLSEQHIYEVEKNLVRVFNIVGKKGGTTVVRLRKTNGGIQDKRSLRAPSVPRGDEMDIFKSIFKRVRLLQASNYDKVRKALLYFLSHLRVTENHVQLSPGEGLDEMMLLVQSLDGCNVKVGGLKYQVQQVINAWRSRVDRDFRAWP